MVLGSAAAGYSIWRETKPFPGSISHTVSNLESHEVFTYPLSTYTYIEELPLSEREANDIINVGASLTALLNILPQTV